MKLNPLIRLTGATGLTAVFATLLSAGQLTVTVTHDLDAPRRAEMIEVPWSTLTEYIPKPMIDHLVVRSVADGAAVPSQVLNYPSTPGGSGQHALIFQHDFAAGEKTAVFLIETTEQPVPPWPAKVFARYVPERYDDFAWENDLVAHRTYGPALAAPAAPGTHKEVLVSSGLDVWCKRVAYPVIDRWYLKEHEGYDYHVDTGEGLDFYSVHTSRGIGGTGIWDGRQLRVSGNWTSWRVLANGPIRAVFELGYDTWDAGGPLVSEVKRITVDAGHQLDRIESTFAVTDNAPEFSVAIGVAKHADIPGQVATDRAGGWIAYWEHYPKNGQLGTGVVLGAGPAEGFAEDGTNHLLLAKLISDQPLVYFAGAGWEPRGTITSAKDWTAYLAAFARQLHSPIRVSFAPAKSK